MVLSIPADKNSHNDNSDHQCMPPKHMGSTRYTDCFKKTSNQDENFISLDVKHTIKLPFCIMTHKKKQFY
ncbi:hypothetical protein HZS_1380 [Henneguya salminicola]|nr:hypothetical protein HZS_1380 [Henneguya salminicola]